MEYDVLIEKWLLSDLIVDLQKEDVYNNNKNIFHHL